VSFSSDVKAELCKQSISRYAVALAEVYGALLYCNTFSAWEVRVITGNTAFAERLPKLVKKAFALNFDEISDAADKRRSFVITDRKKIEKIFAAYGYDANSVLSHHINLSVLEEADSASAFIRGAFLAGGSITNPAKGYHLELVTDHQSVSRETVSILQEMGFEPKTASRSGHYITYFKQSEIIEDLFTLLGAPISAMEIMSAKVEKDMRSAVNRRVNCDNANADKIVSAAFEQLEAIRRLDISALPEKLRETAQLRINNPEFSLADLAGLCNPPVTKSCMSHRLRKLASLAEEKGIE